MKKWVEDMIYRGYALAASGLPATQISGALGIDISTLDDWRKKYPVFDRAINAGYASAKAPTQMREDWVFARLEPHLKAIWLDIENLWERDKGLISERLRDVSSADRQALFLYALSGTTFSVNQSLAMVGVGKKTFDKWLDDPRFAELIAQIEWHKENYIEDKFLGLVHGGYEPAILWAAKTKLAGRGYGQQVKVTGEVDHKHTIGLDLASLGLPPDLLDAVMMALITGPKVGPDGLLMDYIEGTVVNDDEK